MTKIQQRNIIQPIKGSNYFVCGYCGNGCHHGAYCGCAASKREVRGPDAPAVDIDSIKLEGF